MKTRVIQAKDLEDGMTLIGFLDKTATISRVSKGTRYVNFVNDSLGMRDRFGLLDEVTIVVPDEPEKQYLVCINCGEAFDSITAAHEHGVYIPGPDPSWCGEDGFNILPEEDAF